MVFTRLTIGAFMRFLSRLSLAAKVAAFSALMITAVAVGAGFYAVSQIDARMAEIVESQITERTVAIGKPSEEMRERFGAGRRGKETPGKAKSSGLSEQQKQNLIKGVVAVGNDIDTRGNIRCGSLLVNRMTVAGD